MTTGMIIGRRRWRVGHPAADDPADRLLELVGVVDALASGRVERLDDRAA